MAVNAASINNANPNSQKPNKKKQVISTAADTAAVSDTAVRGLRLSRSLSQILSFSDSARVPIYTRAVTDSLSFSEQARRVLQFSRVSSDTLVFADSALTGGQGSFRAVSDTVSFSESLTSLLVLARTLSDAESFGEQLSRVVATFRSVSDIFSASDIAIRILPILKTVIDSLSPSDTSTTLKGFERSLMDILAETDVVTSSHPANYPPATDSFVEFDYANLTSFSAVRAVLDSFSFFDAPTVGFEHEEDLNEVVPESDAAVKNVFLLRSASDNFNEYDTTSPLPGSIHGTGKVIPIG